MDLDIGDTRRIMAECAKRGLLRNQAAYVLATAYWETNRTMRPVVEAYWLSENWRKQNLRYYPWYGRGYVQLTWKGNYSDAGAKIGVNLLIDPNKALRPEVATPILVQGMIEGWFTGKKLADYIADGRSDYINARRIVNGMDKASAIATIARSYEAALLGAGYGVTQPLDHVPVNRAPSFWTSIFNVIFRRNA